MNYDLARLDTRTRRRILITDDCWQWVGAAYKGGYGRALHGLAHRTIYKRLVGPIPDGLTLDHLCRNKLCVNPDHLEPVTQAENNRRRFKPPHCKHGHEFTPENTRTVTDRGKTYRVCAACRRASATRYDHRVRRPRSDRGLAA